VIELEKNSRECLRIENREYQGNEQVALRIWRRGGPSESWKPSRECLSVRRDQVPGLIQALQDVLDEEDGDV